MLYSPANKIGHILHNYNIDSIKYSPSVEAFSMNLTNISSEAETDQQHVYINCDSPLYNAISSTEEGKNFFTAEHNVNLLEENVADSIFDDVQNYTQYKTTDYYKRYKTVYIPDNDIYASEYFNTLNTNDLNQIINLSGITETVRDIYGKFFVDSDDNFRLMFNPQHKLLTDIDEVYFSNLFIHTFSGYDYPILYCIYTQKSDPNNVRLLYSNSLVHSLTSKGICDVSLTSIFAEFLPTIKSDVETLQDYNSKLFIVNNICNFAIFFNTPTGIIRFIPNEFTKQFFNIIYNNMYMPTNTDYSYFCTGDGVENVTENSKLISLDSYADITNFNKILSLTSNAESFNDLIFSIDQSSLTIPIFLIKE